MVVTDVEIVAILAVALIITYFIGTYWKHRTLTKYAHWFEDRFSKRAKVRYKSFGHAGLRIKCEMNNASDGYSDLEFALSLGARENLIYYPYSVVARDFDRLNCWASLTKTPRFRVLLTRKGEKIPADWERIGAEQTTMPEIENVGYVVFSTGSQYAIEFLRRLNIQSKSEALTTVQFLVLEFQPPRLHLTARLHRDGLSGLIDLIGFAARAV